MVLMLPPKLLRNSIQLEHHVSDIIVVWFILNLTKKLWWPNLHRLHWVLLKF